MYEMNVCNEKQFKTMTLNLNNKTETRRGFYKLFQRNISELSAVIHYYIIKNVSYY